MSARTINTIAAIIATVSVSACERTAGPGTAAGPDTAALASITSEDLMRHTQVLASDTFEGRAPGTIGEERSVRYLTEQFKALGLQPGNADGTYTQDVPLVGLSARSTASFNVGGRAIPMTLLTDYVAVSRRVTPEVKVENSDVVFVGYGVVAPEFGWDDYKGLDVRGKTIVMLVNDPAVTVAGDTAVLDTAMFRGNTMTYYGRWTYKYEIAAEKGAAAAIIVHETGPAGYPWEVVSGSWGRENFDVKSADNNMGRAAIESWITLDQAKELFRASGQDFDALKRAAKTKDFKPVPLNAKVNFTLQQSIREIASKNVLAKVEGSELKDEYVIYTSHWDHLGRDSTLQGDQIFNGALDNASGVAALLELAEAYAKSETRPRRSVLFLAVTAEEKGLLGAKYYAENPVYPLAKTLANINMDGVNQWGSTSDVVVIGLGNSTLDDVLTSVAQETQRTIAPDPEAEKGYFYRSDHFEFAKQGVPALYTDAGVNYVGKPPAYSQQKRDEYVANDYHKPSDQVKPDWDLSGAAEDTKVLFLVGWRVAQGDTWPEWKPGTEFKAKRDAMLGK
ncbi:MAG: M28 family metallopeptidase [Gemmatimonadota bacterium]